MVELHGWIIVGWTIGTAFMAFGSAWGAIRVTQKSIVTTLSELRSNVTSLQMRLGEDEKNYITQVSCRECRLDCRIQQSKDNSVICIKIGEVKTLLLNIEDNRAKTKDLNADKFTEIRDRLTKIESKLDS